MPRFEIGIREAKTGQMINRKWDRAELEQAIPWLKRMNARGNDVYIRPAGEHGLVLVDDLNRDALERMKREGFAPTATVETSPGNYQAWVMLSDKPLPPDVRHLAARMLAQRYDGDMNSADSRHYGRLAGFTNQKPEHTRNGKQPFVLARDCSGKSAGAAPALLESIGQLIDKVATRKEREERLEAIRAIRAVRQGHGGHDPVREYQQQAQRLMAK